MKFRDGKERNPEDYGYQIFTQKQVDIILKKKEEDPNYKDSLELVRVAEQTPKVYIYKFKLKDLDIDQGFYTEEFDYVCSRIE